jgi:hypothetical protein
LETQVIAGMVQNISGAIPHKNEQLISFYPRYSGRKDLRPVDPVKCETLLSEWFGRPVILMAAGRCAIHLYLQAKGFHRYEHKVQVPQYMSQCVINTVTADAFPVEAPAKCDATLFYHQYGFSQRCEPHSDIVIEDIAHSFFCSHDTGQRQWVGDAAVFSIPKFFGIGGFAGGLVIKDEKMAEKIREAIQSTPFVDAGVREWMREAVNSAYFDDIHNPKRLFVSCAYELLNQVLRPDPYDLAGFPDCYGDITSIGMQRLERVNVYRSMMKGRSYPEEFWSDAEGILPFALPHFGTGGADSLNRVKDVLREHGVMTDIYHVDVNRNMFSSDFRRCVLIPCHQNIPMEIFESICRAVSANC